MIKKVLALAATALFSLNASAGYGQYGWDTWRFSGRLTGALTQVAADPNMTAYFDSVGGYESGVNRIVPDHIGPHDVPEPASLALFAAGALGAAGALRRRKRGG